MAVWISLSFNSTVFNTPERLAAPLKTVRKAACIVMNVMNLIYINDLPEICEEFARIYLFADDAKLFRHLTCNEDHKALQLGLNALQDWSNKWLLK